MKDVRREKIPLLLEHTVKRKSVGQRFQRMPSVRVFAEEQKERERVKTVTDVEGRWWACWLLISWLRHWREAPPEFTAAAMAPSVDTHSQTQRSALRDRIAGFSHTYTAALAVCVFHRNKQNY